MLQLNTLKTLSAAAVAALLTNGALAAPIVYSAYDSGAGDLASAPASTAAAAAFNGAFSGLAVVDFESAPVGFSTTGDGYVSNTLLCAPELCGYNTTAGGSKFLNVTYNTTFHFAHAIDTFGAYFTGIQRGDATLTYADGSTVVLAMPVATLSVGGTAFFGFSDAGASITSISYFTGTGGDFVAVDDIQYGKAAVSVPEPGTLAVVGLGLAALALSRRRQKN